MVSDVLRILLLVIQALLFIYFFLTTVYFLFFSIAGLFTLTQPKSPGTRLNRFVVLIPGYKEDAVIIDVARRSLDQDYPANLFDVVIIADTFSPGTLDELKKLPVHVMEVVFENSSKAKALKEAMKRLPPDYDSVIILDADNIMEKDFITRINNSINLGYKSIQAHRTAKNQNTPFAVLDTISEEINNQIFRKGHWIVGLSSALIGSGMAFDYKLFRDYTSDMDFILGEEKELEMRMIRDQIKIAYINEAVVYDEKVQKPDIFMVQRARWLATQFIFARLYFLPGITELFRKGNIDFLDKVIQQFLPPRIFLLGFLILISFLSVFLNPLIYTCAWLGLTITCILTLLLSTPRRFYNLRTFKAVFLLPKGFFMMLISLTRIFKVKTKWDHTAHGISN
jgi:cellulose synthase/poly-beta-1,6-N-acetylglucosamine synthase-like glycosyltransferase